MEQQNNKLTVDIMAEIFKIFSDPTRLSIIYELMKGELCVGEISDKLQMSQSSISHQLRILKSKNIVKGRRIGKNILYSITDRQVEEMLKAINELNTNRIP